VDEPHRSFGPANVGEPRVNVEEPVRLVQVQSAAGGTRLGLARDQGVVDLTGSASGAARSIIELIGASGDEPISAIVSELAAGRPATWTWAELDRPPGAHSYLGPPIDAPEIWGAGVTYERSRDAREAESEGFSRFYAMVYQAERPELFLKTAGMARVAGPNAAIAIRSDSNWTVPEPELALVIGRGGAIVGYTIGNDLSARDIEAENPLYLPQAKTFAGSCGLGPAIVLHGEDIDPHNWTIEMRITRDGGERFSGSVPVERMRRSFEELVRYLRLDNEIRPGTVLLTGTGRRATGRRRARTQ